MPTSKQNEGKKNPSKTTQTPGKTPMGNPANRTADQKKGVTNLGNTPGRAQDEKRNPAGQNDKTNEGLGKTGKSSDSRW